MALAEQKTINAIDLRFVDDRIVVDTRVQLLDADVPVSERSDIRVYGREDLVDFQTNVPNAATYVGLIGWDQPATTPIAPPATCTPRQIRLALNQLGLRDQVEQAVAAADQTVRDTWQYSQIIVRTDPLIASMAAGLNVDSATIDQLFALAATL